MLNKGIGNCLVKELLRPNNDLTVVSSGDELTQGLVVTYVDDLLLGGWQHHIDSITKTLLVRYVTKCSGSLHQCPWLLISLVHASRLTPMLLFGATRLAHCVHCHQANNFIGADGNVSLNKSRTPPSHCTQEGGRQGEV